VDDVIRIKFADRGKSHDFWESFKEMFYIGFYKWDDADYGFSIVLFSYGFNWLIYKNKESLFEHQQRQHDYSARYLMWEHKNSIEMGN